ASSIFSVFIICSALTGPVAGRLLDRFGPRLVMPMGAALLSLALFLVSFTQSLWFFRLTYGVLAGAGVSLMGFTTNSALLSRWFERRRGAAVGVAFAGIGIGMMALTPLAERWITAFGWRGAYLCLAGLVAGVIIPLNLFLARPDPQSMGLEMEGGARDNGKKRKQIRWEIEVLDPAWAAKPWTLAAAVRTRPFWLLMLAYCCSSFCYQSTLMHAASAMVDSGLTVQVAAVYLGLVGIFSSGGKVLFGALSDRLGRELTTLLTVCICTLGMLSLIFISPQLAILALTFAFLFGFGYGGATPIYPAAAADLFMGGSFGLIFAVIFLGTGVGGAIGPYVSGLLRDATGSYFLTLSICLVSLWVSIVLLWKSAPGKVRRMVRTQVNPSL
ncbi:MAG: MFS transporter, partial [Proteobacteria bacterium]|nr:MFS transporter [Pseudomonadota bacterium]